MRGSAQRGLDEVLMVKKPKYLRVRDVNQLLKNITASVLTSVLPVRILETQQEVNSWFSQYRNLKSTR